MIKQTNMPTITSMPVVTATDPSERTAEFVNHYNSVLDEGLKVKIILMGLWGSGKTTLLSTARRPILIDSFDPSGTTVIRDKILEANGDIVVRPFWDIKTAYNDWLQCWQYDIKSNYFSNFGTYCIDSLTTFSNAVSWLVTELNNRKDHIPSAKPHGGDYNIIKARIKHTLQMSMAQDCDFILTAHLHQFQDLTGSVMMELRAIGDLKVEIPLLFTEKYVLYSDVNGNRWILTNKYGKFDASTQLGVGGRFELFEQPDIKNLLRKAGIDPTDKPSLVRR